MADHDKGLLLKLSYWDFTRVCKVEQLKISINISSSSLTRMTDVENHSLDGTYHLDDVFLFPVSIKQCDLCWIWLNKNKHNFKVVSWVWNNDDVTYLIYYSVYFAMTNKQLSSQGCLVMKMFSIYMIEYITLILYHSIRNKQKSLKMTPNILHIT